MGPIYFASWEHLAATSKETIFQVRQVGFFGENANLLTFAKMVRILENAQCIFAFKDQLEIHVFSQVVNIFYSNLFLDNNIPIIF